MKYAAIASGSNGNCYYISNGDDAVLVDIGINTKHVLLRMGNLGIDPCSIKAIFITHEHTDHIRGLSVFCKRFQIPIYITAGSYRGTRLHLPEHLVNIITPHQLVEVGSLRIQGIPKTHDAHEPCSFMVSSGGINIAVLTDLGCVCENVKQAIADADILMLESNYDEDLLMNGRYSYYLKSRISGGLGHISNKAALKVFLECRSVKLRHLILTHLSGENNTVELVERTFAAHCDGFRLSVATRYKETELFHTEEVVYTSGITRSSESVSMNSGTQAEILFPEVRE